VEAANLTGLQQYWALIGNAGNDGIALFKLDTGAGTLTPAGIAAPARSPGFLAIAPDPAQTRTPASASTGKKSQAL